MILDLTLNPDPDFDPNPGPPAHLRALLGAEQEGVPNGPLLGPLNAPLQELLVDVLLDKGPRAGAAALALVEEESEVGLLHRIVH